MQSLVLKYSEDTNLSIEKKKEVQSKLNTLKNEYPDNLEEMVEVQSLIDSLKAKDLSRLAKPKTFNNKGKNKFKKKR